MSNTIKALVVGASGITGSNLAAHLIKSNVTTYGLARRAGTGHKGYMPVSADLLNIKSLEVALKEIRPTNVYITTWMRHDTEAENIRVNRLMVSNVLEVLSAAGTVQHVALVTGLKHYLGPFESYAKTGTLPLTPVREEHPRLPLDNFYYAQEDAVFEAAARDGFTWSIHRPHTVIGYAVGNLMNMGTTLAVYASICKETGRIFKFPGSQAQWNGISDVTDARLLAEHLLWASTTDAARNQAFNVANGDVFRWSWLWEQIANWFGIEWKGYQEHVKPLATEMEHDGETWRSICVKHALKEPALERLSSPWHTDLDLGRPIEVMTDMTNSRKLGFTGYQNTRDSFFDLFERLRSEHLIP